MRVGFCFMTALQLFTQALEKATGSTFVSAVTYTPLRIPSYKEYHLILREIGGEGRVFKMSHKVQVFNQSKEEIVDALVEDFIAYVLAELLKNK